MHRFILCIKLPNARDPNISKGKRQIATCFADETFCAFVVSIFLRFSFYNSNICFVKSKGVFWLSIFTNLAITRQSTQMLREASKRDLCFSASCLTWVDNAVHGFISDFHVLVLKWISVVCVRFLFCCLFVIAVLIVSSIIRRCSENINRTVTVHAITHCITSTSAAYVVENTEIIKEQKDFYRR